MEFLPEPSEFACRSSIGNALYAQNKLVHVTPS